MSDQREDCGGDCGSCQRCEQGQYERERQHQEEEAQRQEAEARWHSVPDGVSDYEAWGRAARLSIAYLVLLEKANRWNHWSEPEGERLPHNYPGHTRITNMLQRLRPMILRLFTQAMGR